MKFVEFRDFLLSVRELYQKGGRFAAAADKIMSAMNKARNGQPKEDVFQGFAVTNHGEQRIQHCVKYDLTGFARLVTVQHDNLCILLYAGDHSNVDNWLDSHRGMRVAVRQGDGTVTLETVKVSDDRTRINSSTDLAEGPLWKRIPERYLEPIFSRLEPETCNRLRALESISTDDEVQDACLSAGDPDDRTLLLDVFLLLRAGDQAGAKKRIDLAIHATQPVETVPPPVLATAESGEEILDIGDADPVLWEHFVKTAPFQAWMLYLHPEQRRIVDKDYSGPARLSGVSGSGKTCVIIHRALRLAERYPDGRILVLTLNHALAKLIDELIRAARGTTRPSNLEVLPFWELCRNKLLQLEPGAHRIYGITTEPARWHPETEHIDQIWDEYYLCQNNNRDADVLWPVHKTLLARGIWAPDYIRQEFEYVRSALSPSERATYETLERKGRTVPLDPRYRRLILQGLDGWERKMRAVGAVDYLGVATALHHYTDRLSPEYRCVLVDETQDFGTIELDLVRRLVPHGENDIFLCGDTAQTVHSKHQQLSRTGIDITGRSQTIRKNYRNSREILAAAHEVLQSGFDESVTAISGVEILPPEYANFSTPKPLLLSASDLKDELAYLIPYFQGRLREAGPTRKMCIAICGLRQNDVESIGRRLQLPVLNGSADVMGGQIFLSDLEQTKGFEFDSMAVINCSQGVMPHPDMPSEESFRELCKLYVAMTRAKTELIVSYAGAPSRFLSKAIERFVHASWSEYEEPIALDAVTTPGVTWSSGDAPDPTNLAVTAHDLMLTKSALGLPAELLERLEELVPGHNKYTNRGRTQVEWKRTDEFIRYMSERPAERRQRIGDAAWAQLLELFGEAAFRQTTSPPRTKLDTGNAAS